MSYMNKKKSQVPREPEPTAPQSPHTLLSYLKNVGSPLPLDENFGDKPIEIFLGNHPYDHLRNIKLQQGNSVVLCLTQEELSSLWRSDLYGGNNVDEICNWLNSFGQRRNAAILSHVLNYTEVAEKAGFSIECCESITSVRGEVLRNLCEVVDSLLESGCNISMADFALDVVNKLFVGLQLPEIFQTVEQDVSGPIQLFFNSNSLSEIPNGQISMLGNLAEAGKTVINTLGSTRRPVLHPQSAPVIKVFAVANGAGRVLNEQKICIDPLNGQWSVGHTTTDSAKLIGSPAIMMINDEHPEYKKKNWKGNVVLFAAHFSEIKSVDGINQEALAQMVCELEGEVAAQGFKEKMSNADTQSQIQLMQSYAYNCVNSAPQCKKKYSKKF